MAHVIHATPRLDLRARFTALRETLREERARRRTYARVYCELARMTDRDLADIGIARASIGDVAHDAAYGRI